MAFEERVAPVKELLENLERYNEDYKFYLGGGALRDMFIIGNNVQIKDWDIFAIPENSIPSTIILPKGMKTIVDKTYNLDMAARGVEGIYEGSVPNLKEPVNLISYNKELTLEELAEDFDFNVCQIAMDKTGKVVSTKAFDYFFISRKLVQTKTYADNRMEERYQRMKERLNLT